ncbi:hypothetical protein V5799_017686 [Amblyomma americanum]|uniref:Uncharacterized protein n=1 Tax=Amblyomma americanum TaxID=6943 RepID=A0AAQ4F1E8_AMBAM
MRWGCAHWYAQPSNDAAPSERRSFSEYTDRLGVKLKSSGSERATQRGIDHGPGGTPGAQGLKPPDAKALHSEEARQVFLAVGSPGDGIFPPPSGRYTLPTSTGHAAMFRPVIMLALKPTTQNHVDDIPRLEHDFGATSGTPASSGTSWEAFKRKIQHSG